jgi:hypothetical protein
MSACRMGKFQESCNQGSCLRRPCPELLPVHPLRFHQSHIRPGKLQCLNLGFSSNHPQWLGSRSERRSSSPTVVGKPSACPHHHSCFNQSPAPEPRTHDNQPSRTEEGCRVRNEKLEEERKNPPPSPGQDPALVTNLTSSQGTEHPTSPPYPKTLQ